MANSLRPTGVAKLGGTTRGFRCTIDNQIRSDFILLQFSQAVTLTSATLIAYTIGGRRIDTNATYAWANSPCAWNTGLALNDVAYSTFSSYLTGTKTIDSVALDGGARCRWLRLAEMCG